MTESRKPAPSVEQDRSVAHAWTVARAATHRAGVEIRPLATVEEMTVACRLLDDVWDIPPEDASEVRPSLLRALGHAGNYLVGAYLTAGARQGQLVGASVAFFGTPLGASLHSHITGVLPGSGPGIGSAVKWHQRAWAIQTGLSRITWTYDPLIARNSFFNLNRLGARPRSYFVDFYGPMDDGPNRGQPTDRVDAVWDLHSDSTAHAAGPQLVAGSAGAAAGSATGSDQRLIGIPADIEAIRRADPGLALRWRLGLRTVLAPLMADEHWRVTGFAKSGWYLMERGERR